MELSSHRQITDKPCIVWRYPDLTDEQARVIIQEAESMLGQSYDVLSFAGSMLRWLTGIGWFERVVQNRKKERCHTFVARCYCIGTGIMFGRHHWSEVETDDIDWYARARNWEVVRINEGGR